MKSKKVNKSNYEKIGITKRCKKNKSVVEPYKYNCSKKEKSVNKIDHLSNYLKGKTHEKLNKKGNEKLDENINSNDKLNENENSNDKLDENTYDELYQSVYDELNQNASEEMSDKITNFIFKKKIYEKNIAQMEKKTQTNKLNKLIKTKEIILDMLTIIKNRKLNLS